MDKGFKTMYMKTTISLFGMMIVLQGCSLFEGSGCNNKKAIDAVKKLYAKQVNTKPFTSMEQVQNQFGPDGKQTNLQTQSIVGISLADIKQINTSKSAGNTSSASEPQQNEQRDYLISQFEGADYICEGVIQQHVDQNALTEISKDLPQQDLLSIKNNQLTIPVYYAVYEKSGNNQFQVVYAPQNPAQLMLAIMLKQHQVSSNK